MQSWSDEPATSSKLKKNNLEDCRTDKLLFLFFLNVSNNLFQRSLEMGSVCLLKCCLRLHINYYVNTDKGKCRIIPSSPSQNSSKELQFISPFFVVLSIWISLFIFVCGLILSFLPLYFPDRLLCWGHIKAHKLSIFFFVFKIFESLKSLSRPRRKIFLGFLKIF